MRHSLAHSRLSYVTLLQYYTSEPGRVKVHTGGSWLATRFMRKRPARGFRKLLCPCPRGVQPAPGVSEEWGLAWS